MLKLTKYLKDSLMWIIIIALLLVVQAIADLSLPDYTAKIVNVGIQQSGIEQPIYEKMSIKTMDSFMSLSTIEEQQLINETYTPKNNVYYLENPNEEVNLVIKNKSLLSIILFGENDQFAPIISSLKQELNIDEDTNIDEVFNTLNEEEQTMLIKKIETMSHEIPEMFTNSLVIELIKVEYLLLGDDLNTRQSNYVIQSGLKMLGIALLSMSASVTIGFLGAIVAARFAKQIRKALFEKTLSFSTTEMKKFGIASLITRTTNDVTQVRMIILFTLRVILYAPILGIGALLKAISVSSELSRIIFIIIVLAVFIGLIVIVFALPKINKIQKLVDKLNGVAREMLNGVLVVRAFGNEKHEEDKFKKTSGEIKDTYIFVNSFFSTLGPILSLLMNGVAVLIVWRAASQISAGLIQVGDMMAFIQYAMQVVMAFMMISMFAIRIPRALVSGKRINEVLSTDLTILDPVKPKKFDVKKRGELEFKNVSFRYFDADEDVLCNINFKVTPGKTTAFIGSTGSGKSTLISLIPRLFDVTKGEIILNGVNIKEVTQEDLHDKLGFIFQQGYLFKGTINYNVSLNNKKIKEKDIKQASEIAQAKDFILARENTFNSEIARGGSNVSGGQKQRLAIARAIARKPEIYIFDDSFSALDNTTEKKLRNAINENLKDVTILVVTQRVSSVMNADKIIVLDEGKIVGEGTHQELLKTNKVYQEIALSQLSKQELNYE